MVTWVKASVLLEIPKETLNELKLIARIENSNFYRVAENILRLKTREYLDRIIKNS